MDASNGQSYWLETLELTMVAMMVALGRGAAWTDPKTGAFSAGQLSRALATAGTIAILAAAGQSYWNFPWPITAGISSIMEHQHLTFKCHSGPKCSTFRAWLNPKPL